MKLLARRLVQHLSKTHQSCLRSLITHDVFVISCSPLNSYCQDNQFAVWRRRTWTAHNNEHYTKIIRERITRIFCLKRELHDEFEWEWQVALNALTTQSRQYRSDFTRSTEPSISGSVDAQKILTVDKIQRVLWEHERGLKLGQNKTTRSQFVLYSSWIECTQPQQFV